MRKWQQRPKRLFEAVEVVRGRGGHPISILLTILLLTSGLLTTTWRLPDAVEVTRGFGGRPRLGRLPEAVEVAQGSGGRLRLWWSPKDCRSHSTLRMLHLGHQGHLRWPLLQKLFLRPSEVMEDVFEVAMALRAV